jgi:hypothetical protein
MNGKLRFLLSLVVASVGLAGVFLSPAIANADPLPYTPPPRPANTEWGIPLSLLETSSPASPTFDQVKAGPTGFVNAVLGDEAISSARAPLLPSPRQSVSVYFSDPYVVANKINLKFFSWRLPDNRAQTASWNFWMIRPVLVCSNVEWSKPSTQFSPTVTIAGQSMAPGGSPDGAVFESPNYIVTASSCPYLVSMTVGAEPRETASGTGTRSLGATDLTRAPILGTTPPNAYSQYQVWKAQNFYYGFPRSDSTPEFDLCTRGDVGNYSTECPYYDGVADEWGTFDACANAPQAEWLSYSWVPKVISHWSRCLFTPLQGFDTAGVEAAFTASPITDAIDQTSAALASFSWSEGCGVVINDAPIFTESFDVNTCSMGDWSVAKGFLSIVILLFGGIFALLSVIATTTSSFKIGKFDSGEES